MTTGIKRRVVKLEAIEEWKVSRTFTPLEYAVRILCLREEWGGIVPEEVSPTIKQWLEVLFEWIQRCEDDPDVSSREIHMELSEIFRHVGLGR